MAQQPTLVILAAGMGSRYGGIKQLDEVGPNGEAIIDYSIYDAYKSGFGKVVFIIREDLQEAFDERFSSKLKGKIPVEYAYQRPEDLPAEFAGMEKNREKPWGTGHAIWSCRNVVQEPFIAINADDFYGREAFEVMHNALQKKSGDYYMVGYYLKNTLSEHGSVSRGVCTEDEANRLVSAEEHTNIYKKNDKVYFKHNNEETPLDPNLVVSMNLWGFQTDIFAYLEEQFKEFLQNKPGTKTEFYIPSVVNTLIHTGKKQVRILHSNSRWFGVTYKEDRPVVEQSIRDKIASGIYPKKLW